MEESINYVLYGGVLGVLLIVVIILLVFFKKIMLFLLTNFSDKAVKTTVLEVLEGDTIIVEIPKDKNQPNKTSKSLSVNDENETSWTVRLIGVDTPESRASLYIDESPFGKEALAYTEERLKKNKNIILVFDEQLFDKFEKHLAYIYFPSGECLNATLLKEGYGWIRNHAFDIKFGKEFEKLQEKARTKQKGIWNMYVTKGILREEYKATEHYKEYKKRVEENE
ncbi:thermonuclease family protein [Bernardetia sp. OM2101]|uniref:thermonuclease family protein n=1 Tax=Bernardetia sp. OM2101 TaxID=3344876 RepID=UPI0035CFB36E